MQNKYISPLGFFFLALSFNVMADSAETPEKQDEKTRQWLDLQKNGQQASSHKQTLSGPAAARVYQRYLDSFSHPIPEYYSEVESNPFSNSP